MRLTRASRCKAALEVRARVFAPRRGPPCEQGLQSESDNTHPWPLQKPAGTNLGPYRYGCQ
eukprot:2445321-Pyramimonas_sp.AAC.1